MNRLTCHPARRTAHAARRPAHRTAGSLLAVLLGAAVLLPGVASATPEDDFNLAVGYYKKARWEQAAEVFAAFVVQNPQHPRAASAQYYRGLALVNAEQYAAARDALREYVRKYPAGPSLPEALYRIGEADYSLGDVEAAQTAFTEFLKRYPKHELGEYALPYLADAQLRLDQPQRAAATFRDALQKYPQGRLADEATFGLARSYEALNRPADAQPLYQQLAAGNSGRAAASQLRIGTLLYDAADYAAAAEAFDALVTRFPTSPLLPTARLNAGFALYRGGDPAAALRELEIAAQTPAQAATALYWSGVAQQALGETAAATAAFQKVLDEHPDDPIAAESRFQAADLALRYGDAAVALRLFEQVAADPQGPHAAEAVHLAGEAALLSGDIDRAAELVATFAKEYPQTAFRMHNRLLAGRVLEAQAAAAEVSDERREELQQQALAEYAAVLTESKLESTQDKARYQIARLHERRDEPAEAVAAVAPLVDVLAADADAGGPVDPVRLDALIIAARAQLALNEPEAAIAAATLYLDRAPTGDQADAALAARAAALLAAGRSDAAIADVATLRASFPQSDLLRSVVRSLAERAYAADEFAAAASLFGTLGEVAAGTDSVPVALSGQGWALYRAGKYADAAAAFGAVVDGFPTADPLAPEAAYMRGKSWQDGGDLPAAADAYATAFKQYAPTGPAAPGAEAEGPLRNVYLAGLQQARVLRLQHKTADADAAYAALVETFPEPRNLDDLLDEWALLHYEAEDFTRADALFRRLIAERPDSDKADNARLSLAESAVFAGRLDEAGTALRAIADDARAADGVKQRAMSLLVSLAAERGDWPGLVALADAYLDQFATGRERPLVLYQLGQAQLQLSKTDAAVATLAQVVAMDDQPAIHAEPWFPRVYVLLAEAAFQQKDYPAAERFVAQVLDFEPRPVYAYAAQEILGRILKNQSKFDAARTAFEQVLADPEARLTETAARAQYEVAQTHFLQENWQAANQAAFKVYTLYKFPQWQAPALYMAALSDEALGRREQAVVALGDVVTEFPTSQYAGLAKQKLAELAP